MERLSRLIQTKDETVGEMRSLIAKAESESRDLTAEELGRYNALEAKLDKVNDDIRREDKLGKAEAELNRPVRSIKEDAVGKSEEKSGFGNFGEFLYAVRFEPTDRRLIECRTQQMKEGTAGGYMVPNQFSKNLLQVTPQTAIVRPRANVIPAGSPPDASITMPALDQSAGQGMYGGVAVTWVEEGGAKAETGFKLKEITLTPHEVAAYIIVTDKLLRNWDAAGPMCENLLRKAIIASEDMAFLTGSGIGKPKGVINQAAKINVARNTANDIKRADIDSMYTQIWEDGGQYVWLASPTCKAKLMVMTDESSGFVWMGNYASKEPPTILGMPVFWSQRNPALGSEGDLMLVNLSYYLIKDGSGPYVEASPHVYFTSNKTVIKAFWNVDGDGWLQDKIALEGSTANTLSPFVVLK